MRPRAWHHLDELFAGQCDGMTYEEIEVQHYTYIMFTTASSTITTTTTTDHHCYHHHYYCYYHHYYY